MRRVIAAAAAVLACAATVPAQAVPGWANDSAHLDLSPAECRGVAERAIRSVTGGPAGSPSQTYSSMGSLVAGYTTDTGIFIHCMADPHQVCQRPSSTVSIVAFSDNGSGHAAQLRDRVRASIGDPHVIDCN